MKTGEKYGRLTAVCLEKVLTGKERVQTRKYRKVDGSVTEYKAVVKPKQQYWKFACECGNEHVASATSVKYGNTKSCGCLLKENKGRLTHGHAVGLYTGKNNMDKTYMSWVSMKQRCSNPTHGAFHRYGAVGIGYCDRWEKFENFLEDMGERPSRDYSLDRIDGTKGYSKENCRWATRKEQGRNMRSNVWVKINGVLVKRVEEAEKIGISSLSLGKRIENGWDDRDFADGKKHLNTGNMRKSEKNYKDEKKRLMDIFKRSAQVVSTYLSVLEPRERSIIENRLGMKDGKRMTLDEIGKEQGCTRERVRQIEARAMEKMMKFYYELSR